MKKLAFLILSFFSILRAEVLSIETPVVILGGGIGALTSALYLARAGIPPLVIMGQVPGGTITQSHSVQNWPGEIGISGVELADKVKKQAEKNGALLQDELLVSVDFSKSPYTIVTRPLFGTEPKYYKTKAVIIALGSSHNHLHVPGETQYWSKGVYNCAVCDGALYKDQIVGVVGGGDCALLEAQYLSAIAKHVHVFVRKGNFKALEALRLKEVLNLGNVTVHYNTTIEQIQGDGEKLTQVITKKQNHRASQSMPLDALFLAIGSRPNTRYFQSQLALDAEGYILLKNHQQTSLEGIYAIGDVADPEFKQAISAAGDAAKAALQAHKFLTSCVPLTSKKEVAVISAFSPSKKILEIHSKEQFEDELQANTIVFADFYSTYCAPCRTFYPLYENWAKQYGNKIKFLKVNAEKASSLFKQYQIRAVPTLLIFNEQGEVIRKIVGSQELALIDKKLQSLKDQALLTSADFK